MPEKIAKRCWTRTEKWLFAAPLLVLLCLFGMTTGKEIVRRRMLWPVRVIPVSGKDYLRLFALSPNGEFSIGQGETTTLKFYNARSGAFSKSLQVMPVLRTPSPFDLHGVDFLAEKNLLALGFVGKPIEIWNTKTSSLLTRLPADASKLSFSLDGRYLATNNGELWDLNRKKLKFRFSDASDRTPVFSSDSALLAVPARFDYKAKESRFYGGDIHIWNVKTGQLQAKFPAPIPDKTFSVVAFTPNGKRVACLLRTYPKGLYGTLIEKDLRIYDVLNGRELWRQKGKWMDLAFSPDGRWVALSTRNDCVQLCEAETGKLITTLHSKWPDVKTNITMGAPAVRFTGDGKLLVLRGLHDIFVWNMDEVNARFAL